MRTAKQRIFGFNRFLAPNTNGGVQPAAEELNDLAKATAAESPAAVAPLQTANGPHKGALAQGWRC